MNGLDREASTRVKTALVRRLQVMSLTVDLDLSRLRFGSRWTNAWAAQMGPSSTRFDHHYWLSDWAAGFRDQSRDFLDDPPGSVGYGNADRCGAQGSIMF